MIQLFLIFFISINTHAGALNVNSGEMIKSSDLNNIHKADYDSGWFAVSSTPNNTITKVHNLGQIPSRIVLLVSNEETDSPTRIIRPTPLQSLGDTYHSPENTGLTKNIIYFNMYNLDEVIRCDTGANPCYSEDGSLVTNITARKNGFFKVLLWK